MRCPRCGNENSDENRFCGMCGAKMLPAPAVVASTPVTVSASPQASSARPTPPLSPAAPLSRPQAITPDSSISATHGRARGVHQWSLIPRFERSCSPQTCQFELRSAFQFQQSRLPFGRRGRAQTRRCGEICPHPLSTGSGRGIRSFACKVTRARRAAMAKRRKKAAKAKKKTTKRRKKK